MQIALDSNVLIADPRLDKQRTRVLLDYARKTRSRLVLLDPVWQEVAAHTHRKMTKAAEDVGAALREAARQGVSELPEVDVAASVARSYAAWEAEFRTRLGPDVADWVPLEPSILPEVVRRAARRLPPVRVDGRETRDAIIWLSLVHHLRRLAPADACAFVSNNTTDFAASDGTSLRPDLRRDLDGVREGVVYYATVDAFLKEHAEPIGHITREWILARLDLDWVTARVADRLLGREPPVHALRPVGGEVADYYQPYAVERVVDAAPSLDGVYVYAAAPDATEVSLEVAVDVTVEAECYMTTMRGLARSVDDDARERYQFARSLTCAGEFLVTVAAEARGDHLRLTTVEEIEPR